MAADGVAVGADTRRGNGVAAGASFTAHAAQVYHWHSTMAGRGVQLKLADNPDDLPTQLAAWVQNRDNQLI